MVDIALGRKLLRTVRSHFPTPTKHLILIMLKTLKIAFVGGLSDRKLLQKLVPLEELEEVASIELFRREKLASSPKTRWMPIPGVLQQAAPAAELYRFLLLILYGWKYDIIVGCNQAYHGVMAYLAGVVWRKPVIQIITTDVGLVCGNGLFKKAIMSSKSCAVRGAVSAERLKAEGYRGHIEILANIYPDPFGRSVVQCKDFIPPEGGFDLVFVSHYTSKAKDFPWLMQILAGLKAVRPDFKMAIVGGEHAEKLAGDVEKYALADNIVFTGELHGDSLDKVYKSSKILLLTSRVEGLPMVVVEAMSFGLPMVVTAVGDIPWLVRDGKEGFLVKNGDTASTVDRISRLLSSPEEMLSFKERSERRYKEIIAMFQPAEIRESWRRLVKAAVL